MTVCWPLKRGGLRFAESKRRTDYTYDLAGRLVEQKQRAGQEDGSAARLYLRYDYEDGTNRLLRVGDDGLYV